MKPCVQTLELRRPHTRQQTRRKGPPKLSRPQYQWRLLESSRRLYTGSLPQLLPAPGPHQGAQPSNTAAAQPLRPWPQPQLGPPPPQPAAAAEHRLGALALVAKMKHAQASPNWSRNMK